MPFPPSTKFLTKALHTLVIMILISSTGCASRYDPLRPSWFEPGNDTLENCNIKKDDKSDYPYSKGIYCAERVRGAYLEASVSDATLSDKFGLTTIPLSMAAIGVGVAGVTGGNTLLGLAVGSGTLLGWGTWMTSSTQREIYDLGVQAINCVISASEPLNVPQSRITRITDNREALVVAINGLNENVGKVKNDEYANSEKGKIDAAKKLSSATNTLSEAKEALKEINIAEDHFSSAGLKVWNATKVVHSMVVSAQTKNANDLRNYDSYLQNTVFGNFQNIIGLSATSTPIGKKEKGAEPQALDVSKQTYEKLITNLETSQSVVVNLIGELDADLQSITIVDPKSSFANCLNPIQTFKASNKLIVTEEIHISPDQEKKINIISGTPPFIISESWPDTVALTISPNALPRFGSVTIKAGAKESVPAGTYTLFVVDADGTRTYSNIVVSATPTVLADDKGGGNETANLANYIVTTLNMHKDLNPKNWKGLTSDAKWTYSDEKDHLFYLKAEKKEDNKSSLEKLKTFAGVPNAMANELSFDIELRMTKTEMKTLKNSIETTKLPNPGGDDSEEKVVFKTIEEAIRNALRNSSVQSSQWKNVGEDSEGNTHKWMSAGTNANNELVFYLTFKSVEDAEAAKKDPKVSKISTLGGKEQSIPVKNNNTDLQLHIPKERVLELSDALGKTWPQK